MQLAMQSAHQMKDADVELSAHHPRYRQEHGVCKNQWHTDVERPVGRSIYYSTSSWKKLPKLTASNFFSLVLTPHPKRSYPLSFHSAFFFF